MIIVWIIFATLFLVISLAVHVSTFLGVDPIESYPNIMWLHILIFPSVLAAIYYVARATGSWSTTFDWTSGHAPKPLQRLSMLFFAYALVNAFVFIVFLEDGTPSPKEGGYYLHHHGEFIREISEAEFHVREAYEVRAFSGHWMFFACLSITMLVGAGRFQSQLPNQPPFDLPTSTSGYDSEGHRDPNSLHSSEFGPGADETGD